VWSCTERCGEGADKAASRHSNEGGQSCHAGIRFAVLVDVAYEACLLRRTQAGNAGRMASRPHWAGTGKRCHVASCSERRSEICVPDSGRCQTSGTLRRRRPVTFVNLVGRCCGQAPPTSPVSRVLSVSAQVGRRFSRKATMPSLASEETNNRAEWAANRSASRSNLRKIGSVVNAFETASPCGDPITNASVNRATSAAISVTAVVASPISTARSELNDSPVRK
jgi:hypothetical protein